MIVLDQEKKQNILDSLDEAELRFHPQRRFNMLVAYLQQGVEQSQKNETSIARIFTNMRIPLMISSDNTGATPWDILLLNYGPNKDPTDIFFVDVNGNLGEYPTSHFRLLKRFATASEIVNTFALMEALFAHDDKLIEAPFQTCKIFMEHLKALNQDVTLPPSTLAIMHEAQSLWMERNQAFISKEIASTFIEETPKFTQKIKR